MTNSTTARLSLEARTRIEEKNRERDTQIARLNSARASQKDDGRDRMRREVAINLEAIRLMEQGMYPYLANREAERIVDARLSLGVSA